MSYKNTMKLFASNFNLVWKQVVYILACVLLLVISSYTTIRPIVSLLRENNIGVQFQELFDMISYSPNELALKFCDICKNIISVIFNNFGKISVSFIFAILLCFVLPFVLVQMSIFNLSSIAYQKTTMNMEVKYSRSALTTFKAGLKYALSNIIFTLPFVLVEFVLIFVYLLVAKSILSALIGMVLLSALMIFIKSFQMSIFAHYTGLLVSQPQNNFKAFAKSITIVLKNFWKNLSTSITLHLSIVVVNSFVMVFTFFAGLVVTIPATFVLTAFYYIVCFLNTTGQRYYLTDAIIYNPVKHVVKKDDFVTISIPEVSNVIEVETTDMKKTFKKHKK